MDEDIVAQGRKSYWANKGKMDNPYEFGTPEYNDFERGWVQACKRDASHTSDGIAYTRMNPNPNLSRAEAAEETKRQEASAYAKASGG
jgi:hypothetical protein